MAKFLRRRSLTTLPGILLLLLLIIYLARMMINNVSTDGELMEISADYQDIKDYLSNASEGSWQYVSDQMETENKFLAFSAFLDNRQINKVVTIIAVRKLKERPRREVHCKFWYQNDNGNNTKYYSSIIPATTKVLKENWGLPYSAYYVLCPIHEEVPPPTAVSLVLDSATTRPNNLFKVINNLKINNEQPLISTPSFSVCVKPLHFNYNKVMEFIEFIELHQIMGVSHFFLYNHSVGPQVDCILEKYINDGIVTVLPWQLPIISQEEIRTEGIFASLNDCLHRTMHRFTYSIFVDFDEYIMPKNNYTYLEFMEHIKKHNDVSKTAAFVFRNAFFYRQWPDDPEVQVLKDPLAAELIVLKKTRRKTELQKYTIRSKYIARPELVNMVGNHFIWEYFTSKYRRMDINPNDGILHHYRVCEFGGDACVDQDSVIDKTAYRYKNELIPAVRSRIEKYKNECQLEFTNDKVQ